MSRATRPSQAVALRGLIRKEMLQIRRDRRLLPLLVVAPLVQLFVLGYAATLDVTTLRVAVLDRDHSAESRDLVARIAASETFELGPRLADDGAVERELDAGDADLGVVIPAGFARRLGRGEPSTVQLVVDGSNSVAASVGLRAAVGVVQAAAERTANRTLARLGAAAASMRVETLRVEPRVWYNPELRSRMFMVPGVLGLVLMIVTTVATSMAIVREKERGTLEQLIVTPVARSTLLASKLVPFSAIGFVDALLVLALAHFWFEVPVRGSVFLLIGCFVPFLVGTLGLGLLVSTVSRTQQQAMMTAMFFVVLPMIYLSGFIFPIESMPLPVQPLTEVVPLKHFLVLVRDLTLKGSTLAEMTPALLKLTGLSALTFAVAVGLFRKRLD